MNILALDLSLTSSGWARCVGGVTDHGLLEPHGRRGYERLEWIRSEVLRLAAGADLVVIEGYSFGSRGNAILSAAELGGVIRMALHDLGYRWVDVPPATLKKLATGKGNASKEQVLAAAIRRLGYEGASPDEADALWLLEATLQHYGCGSVELPKAHREALGKVEWPEITVTAR